MAVFSGQAFSVGLDVKISRISAVTRSSFDRRRRWRGTSALLQPHLLPLQLQALSLQFFPLDLLPFALQSQQFRFFLLDAFSLAAKFFALSFQSSCFLALSAFDFSLSLQIFASATFFFPQQSLAFPEPLTLTFLLKWEINLGVTSCF